MSFEDFCRHFTHVDACHVMNTSFTLKKTWREQHHLYHHHRHHNIVVFTVVLLLLIVTLETQFVKESGPS
ncbi:hypothetical protein ACOMHN_020656 [Nucella lapillus]